MGNYCRIEEKEYDINLYYDYGFRKIVLQFRVNGCEVGKLALTEKQFYKAYEIKTDSI